MISHSWTILNIAIFFIKSSITNWQNDKIQKNYTMYSHYPTCSLDTLIAHSKSRPRQLTSQFQKHTTLNNKNCGYFYFIIYMYFCNPINREQIQFRILIDFSFGTRKWPKNYSFSRGHQAICFDRVTAIFCVSL